MHVVQADEKARERLERVRREANLAKLEYQCQVLRGKWAQAVAVMRKRGAHADKNLEKNLKRWAATIKVLEERVAREAAALELLEPRPGIPFEHAKDRSLRRGRVVHHGRPPPSSSAWLTQCV